jgi:hypothetical protein
MKMDNRDFRAYANVVADYRNRYAGAHRAELAWFGEPGELAEVIRRACLSRVPKKRGDGLKRHSHQPFRSVSDDALLEAASRLEMRTADIQRTSVFANLLALINDEIQPISGIGELAAYDIALRIGAFCGVLPTEVYLHAGTRKGAAALGLDASRKSIPVSSLPTELQLLEADEAEDVLCIYRHALGRIRQGVKAVTPPRSACLLPAKPNRRRTAISGCY